MATKPTDTFQYATDANYTSGPDTGQPTKVNPAGFPTVAQGGVPGAGIVASFINKILNITGQWINNWLLLGSSAGAADAHIVETDALGDTKFRNLTIVGSGKSIAFDRDTDGPTGAEVFIFDQSGNGANPGGDIVLQAQKGQTQTGVNTNNDGGAVRIASGQKGSGGSGTGGKGFGGAALDGAIEEQFPTWTSVRRYAEGWNLAAGAAATKVLNIAGPADLQSMMVLTRLIAVENGGGASPATSGQFKMFVILHEAGAITINAQQTIAEQEGFATNGPNVTITDATGNTLDINVTGATSETSIGMLYVETLPGRVSA